MKKLMVMLSAAATAFGLFAADPVDIATEGFEGESWAPDGTTWSCTDDAATLTQAPTRGEEGMPSSFGAPSQFLGKDNEKFLKVKTAFGKPLVWKGSNGRAIGDGLYFDSLVKLTACDTDPEVSNAKLAVYVKTSEDESTTNLYVKAGYITSGNSVVSKVYDCGPWYKGETWTRLTIKMIADILDSSTYACPGFVIYLDGLNAGGGTEVGADAAKMDADAPALEAGVAEFGKALFPAFVDGIVAGSGNDTITEIGFDGQGSLDDLVITEKLPFDNLADKEIYTITKGDHVTGYDVEGVECKDGKIVYSGTTLEGWIKNIVCEEGYYCEDIKLEITGAGTLTIGDSAKVAAAQVSIDGVSTPCAKIADALVKVNAAESAATLKLFGGEDGITDSILIENAAADITIDLNGKTINGGDGSPAIVVVAGNVTIINSAEVEGIVNSETGTALSKLGGVVTIEAGVYNGACAGTDEGDLIKAGKFDYELNGEWGECNIVATFPAGKMLVANEDETYWVLGDRAKISVIFLAANGETNKTIEVTGGTKIPAEEIPTDIASAKAWESLSGWTKDGVAFDFGTAIEEETTLAPTFKFLDGEGTSDNPWLVASAADLKKLAVYVDGKQETSGKVFKQTADIDMKDAGTFQSIGKYNGGKVSEQAFRGTYDGDNFTIRNVTIASAKYAGLFQEVDGGTIQNLILDTVQIEGELLYTPKDANNNAFASNVEKGGAMLVGGLYNGTIKNVTTRGSFGTADAPLTATAAGLVTRVFGDADHPSTIESCTNEAAMYTAAAKAAGILGLIQTGKLTIKDCVNKGNIYYIHKGITDNAGGYAGIVAHSIGITIENCSNSGLISIDTKSGACVGQIVGHVTADGTVATGCSGTENQIAYSNPENKTISGLDFAIVDNGVATFVKNADLDPSKTYKVMASGATYTVDVSAAKLGDTVCSFDTALFPTWAPTFGDTNHQLVKNGNAFVFSLKGDGSEGAPFEIYGVNDLVYIKDQVETFAGKYIKQMADIALTEAFDGIGARDMKDTLGNDSLEAYTSAAVFKGTYDGDNHTISGFIMNTGDYIGFFNSCYGATIKNLKISLGNATGWSDAAAAQVGAVFAGVTVDTTIENCETVVADGNNTFKASKTAAGFVGFAANGTVIKDCVNNLNIWSADNEKAGGFVACAQSGNSTGDGIVIDGCSNLGDITNGKQNSWGAGFVGYADLKVTFKGANIVKGTITVVGNAPQSLVGVNSGSVAVDSGATFTVPAGYKTVNNKAVAGLFFATVDSDVATLVSAPAAGGSYKVMADGAAFQFTAAGTITLDESLASATVTVADEDKFELKHEGNVYTCTAKSADEPIVPGEDKPIEIDPQLPEEQQEAAAQAAAAKIPVALTKDDEAAGLEAKYLKTVAVKVNGSWVAQVDVNPDVVPAPEVATEAEKPIEVKEDEFAATVKSTIPGLWYGFDSVGELGGEEQFAPVGEFERGTGGAMTLTVPRVPGKDKAFFKISIRAFKPTTAAVSE